MTETLRIARYLARCGVTSRRKAEELVSAGRVQVNGAVATDLGRQINPNTDIVTLDGQLLSLEPDHVTLALHKPRGVMVTRSDPQGRQTVYDLLPIAWQPLAARLMYVGRLDYLTEGLLLLTTDGELVHALTHPARHVEKEYNCWCNPTLEPAQLEQLKAGVDLEEGPARARSARSLEDGRGGIAIVLVEGRNRVVRRMVNALGSEVRRLVRVRVGGVTLQGLERGEWRALTGAEVRRLMAASGKVP